ncbi:hypothetical protein ACIQVR_38410 [Streptomyces xanthochromogenes]|uniref:hypothetical protein n=1 Tax=Streptomyces xanthochromogenes TaxID=67384 RepID=UPI003806E74F
MSLPDPEEDHFVGALMLVSGALAGPAHADDDSNFGGGVTTANNWNPAAVCLQEVAVIPVLGDDVNSCSDGNVIDRSRW